MKEIMVYTNGVARKYNEDELYNVYRAYIENYLKEHIQNNYKQLFYEDTEKELTETEKSDMISETIGEIDLTEELQKTLYTHHIIAQ